MKNKILTILFCLFISIFFIFNIISKDIDISYAERRHLNKLPDHSVEAIMNGDFFNDFEKYATDQFVMRNSFRKFKAKFNFSALNMKDYNNLYIKDNYIYKIDYPLNNNQILKFTKKINYILNKTSNNNHIYLSIIPDKNFYSQDNYLKIDYNKLIDTVKNNINNKITYIDITKDLSLNNYYYTDIHWKQETLNDVVNTLSENMKFHISNIKSKENIYKPFYGSYYGQLGLSNKTDTIIYKTNYLTKNAKVKDIESNLTTIYDPNALANIDSYDVFVGGATPIIEIESNSHTNKELVIFRDSFASSITPLLLGGYDKITLIDLRYIDFLLLNKYITFNNQDILFLYNTTIINNSDILKVNFK